MPLIQFVCLTPDCRMAVVGYPEDEPVCNSCNAEMLSVHALTRLREENARLRKALEGARFSMEEAAKELDDRCHWLASKLQREVNATNEALS